MQCFSFTEQAVPFLHGVLDEDRDPVIVQPEGCGVSIVLGKEFHQRLSRAATLFPTMKGFRLGYNATRAAHIPERERRVGVEVDIQADTLVLKPGRRRRRFDSALVRIETAGGVNGKVWLSSSVHSEQMKGGRVVENYHPFPSMGIQPLCDAGTLERVNKGVEVLDLFVLLEPGARFRIHRTGSLEGAKRTISVYWTGEELYPNNPFYEDRAVGGVFAAA